MFAHAEKLHIDPLRVGVAGQSSICCTTLQIVDGDVVMPGEGANSAVPATLTAHWLQLDILRANERCVFLTRLSVLFLRPRSLRHDAQDFTPVVLCSQMRGWIRFHRAIAFLLSCSVEQLCQNP